MWNTFLQILQGELLSEEADALPKANYNKTNDSTNTSDGKKI